MVINQGDVFWINFGKPSGSSPAYKRPCLILQNNLFNRSQINTVVVCAITSNIDRAKAPGNILLFKKEANLPKQSVVNISQIYTMDKMDLNKKIGSLSIERFEEVLSGVSLLIQPRDIK
ncbi:Programmed cell death toxin YdcE [hydrothermal vent metagenome]|uniref:Programmed cell death toxin YdcE n=1 Tax=hydrothermal vent metagenome TaxID=652676 RepID=A0A3B1D2B5_9ZZZZ